MDRSWQKIPLPKVKPKPRVSSSSSSRPSPAPDPLAGQVVQATVAARSSVPDAGTTPYPDLVMTVRLSNIRSSKSVRPQPKRAGDIVVYTWGLRGAPRTSAAGWKVGQSVTLRLAPWSAVEQDVGGYDRTDLEGDAAAQLKAYWTTDSG